jgi:YaaC-like Protein
MQQASRRLNARRLRPLSAPCSRRTGTRRHPGIRVGVRAHRLVCAQFAPEHRQEVHVPAARVGLRVTHAQPAGGEVHVAPLKVKKLADPQAREGERGEQCAAGDPSVRARLPVQFGRGVEQRADLLRPVSPVSSSLIGCALKICVCTLKSLPDRSLLRFRSGRWRVAGYARTLSRRPAHGLRRQPPVSARARRTHAGSTWPPGRLPSHRGQPHREGPPQPRPPDDRQTCDALSVPPAICSPGCSSHRNVLDAGTAYGRRHVGVAANPSLASTAAGLCRGKRTGVFVSALEQAEQLMNAAAAVGPAASPLLLFYAVSQAGRAIAAARLDDPWRLAGHGLKTSGALEASVSQP